MVYATIISDVFAKKTAPKRWIMLFNSYVFILLFLPITILGYFGWNHFGKYQTAKAFLFGMSLWFYGYFRPSYLVILVTSILVNYAIYRFLSLPDKPKNIRKTIMILGVVLNLGTLGYFKYLDYLFKQINLIFHADLPILGIVLPLGISFFTFQQLGFVIDAYRGETKEYSILDYALFVAFFPQLVAGPIVTYAEMIPQFQDASKKRFNAEHLANGVVYFILGMSKKLLLADAFGRVVDYAWATVDYMRPADVCVTALSFYLQIYFDFSGYSDMAIGLGKMLNLELPVNFNSPFKAITIADYWKRWHMTLTRFFTKYVYIPLGGNRKGTARTYLNVFLVFLLSGIWHGAGTGYVVWGISGGIGIIVCKMLAKPLDKLGQNKVSAAGLWLFTMIYVAFFFSFFRAEDAGLGLHFFARLLPSVSGSAVGIMKDFPKILFDLSGLGYKVQTMQTPICFGFNLLSFFIATCMPNVREIASRFRYTAIRAIGLAALFMLCFLSLSGVATYIYFNF